MAPGVASGIMRHPTRLALKNRIESQPIAGTMLARPNVRLSTAYPPASSMHRGGIFRRGPNLHISQMNVTVVVHPNTLTYRSTADVRCGGTVPGAIGSCCSRCGTAEGITFVTEEDETSAAEISSFK